MECVVCDKSFNKGNFLVKKYGLCDTCNLKTRIHHYKGVAIHFLFEYKGSARRCVIESKGNNDYLSKFIKQTSFYKIHKNWLWVPAPAYKDNHLNQTLDNLKVEYQEVFVKTKDYKQKNLTKVEREKMANVKISMLPTQHNIVLFDDTKTTGSTIEYMIQKLKKLDYNIIVFVFCANPYKPM